MIRWLRYDRNRKSAGFALVDIILGIAILSVALVGIAFAYRQSTVTTVVARNYNQATYYAQQALEMGLVNAVVPVAQLEAEGVKWAEEILDKSPIAIRCLKAAFNCDVDGQQGIQELAGNATMLYYMTDEAKEFHRAQREKRKPDARKYPWLP